MSRAERLRTVAPAAEAERISDDELAYHCTVLEQSQQAEALLAEVRAIMARAEGMQAARQSWSVHLAAKYSLHDGDGITPDGEIVRASRTVA